MSASLAPTGSDDAASESAAFSAFMRELEQSASEEAGESIEPLKQGVVIDKEYPFALPALMRIIFDPDRHATVVLLWYREARRTDWIIGDWGAVLEPSLEPHGESQRTIPAGIKSSENQHGITRHVYYNYPQSGALAVIKGLPPVQTKELQMLRCQQGSVIFDVEGRISSKANKNMMHEPAHPARCTSPHTHTTLAEHAALMPL